MNAKINPDAKFYFVKRNWKWQWFDSIATWALYIAAFILLHIYAGGAIMGQLLILLMALSIMVVRSSRSFVIMDKEEALKHLLADKESNTPKEIK